MKLNYGKTIYTFRFGGEAMTVNNIVQAWLTANRFSLVNNFDETYYYNYDAWYGDRCFQYAIEGDIITVYAWTISIKNKFVMLDSGALNNMSGNAYKELLNTLFSEITANCAPNPPQNIVAPQASAPSQNPAAPQNAATVQNNEAPQYTAPVQNTAVPQYTAPVQNTAAPQYTAPVQNTAASQYADPAQNPNPAQNPYAGVPDSAQFTDVFEKDILDKNSQLCNIGFILSIIGLFISMFGMMYGFFIYFIEIYFAYRGLKSYVKGRAIAIFILTGISILIIILKLVLR